jgi:hypothetical protein
MNNESAYLAAIHTNDGLLEIYNKINHNMTLTDEAQTRASLCEIALTLKTQLNQYGALTIERGSQLDRVREEAAQAAEAAKREKPIDIWAALTRAHGLINKVIGDVLEKMG